MYLSSGEFLILIGQKLAIFVLIDMLMLIKFKYTIVSKVPAHTCKMLPISGFRALLLIKVKPAVVNVVTFDQTFYGRSLSYTGRSLSAQESLLGPGFLEEKEWMLPKEPTAFSRRITSAHRNFSLVETLSFLAVFLWCKWNNNPGIRRCDSQRASRRCGISCHNSDNSDLFQIKALNECDYPTR